MFSSISCSCISNCSTEGICCSSPRAWVLGWTGTALGCSYPIIAVSADPKLQVTASSSISVFLTITPMPLVFPDHFPSWN